MREFKGIFAVMVSAYDESGDIDRGAMRHMTEYLVDSGIHGLVVLGSNGECPYLTGDLQRVVIDTVVEACDGAVPVIVGVNERGTEPALEIARYAEKAGADGLLLALHVFYPVTEEAVFEYYEAVCKGIDIPVLFYNFPANTGLTMSPESIAKIAEIENVVGAKETIFDVEEVKGLVEATGEDFRVFTGMCFNLVATMEVGARGAICPVPNLIPEKTVELYETITSGDAEKATGLQNELYSLAPLLASGAPHSMLKEALRLMGHPVNTSVKSPLARLTRPLAEKVKEILSTAGLLE